MAGSETRAAPSLRALCCALLLFRALNGLVVVTYFNPDEYWQSIEVAHRWVFGYGYLTWEWAPDARIRGAAHPAMFALLYKFLGLTGLDSQWAVAWAPRLLQAVFSAAGDVACAALAQSHAVPPGAAARASSPSLASRAMPTTSPR